MVLNSVVGLVVFFSHIQMNVVVVGIVGKRRKERKGKERERGTCRCREKQDGSGDWMNE